MYSIMTLIINLKNHLESISTLQSCAPSLQNAACGVEERPPARLPDFSPINRYARMQKKRLQEFLFARIHARDPVVFWWLLPRAFHGRRGRSQRRQWGGMGGGRPGGRRSTECEGGFTILRFLVFVLVAPERRAYWKLWWRLWTRLEYQVGRWWWGRSRIEWHCFNVLLC